MEEVNLLIHCLSDNFDKLSNRIKEKYQTEITSIKLKYPDAYYLCDIDVYQMKII